MKVIFNPPPVVCVIVEDDGDNFLLEPVDGDRDGQFWIGMGSPYIVVDPTDGEVEDANGKSSKDR